MSNLSQRLDQWWQEETAKINYLMFHACYEDAIKHGKSLKEAESIADQAVLNGYWNSLD